MTNVTNVTVRNRKKIYTHLNICMYIYTQHGLITSKTHTSLLSRAVVGKDIRHNGFNGTDCCSPVIPMRRCAELKMLFDRDIKAEEKALDATMKHSDSAKANMFVLKTFVQQASSKDSKNRSFPETKPQNP